MVAWLALCAVTLVVGVLVTRRLTARGRTLDAVLVVAIVGVLVSPVSWTHHWCFLVLVPVLLLVEQGRPKAVTWAMATVLVVAAISPYGWHLHGAGAVLASFSLVLAGAGLLAAMALAELRRPEWSQHAPGDVVDAPVSSVR
jgi:alpha-1,2-mannosyltransferase